jgi:hypothetical protein
MVDRPLQRGDLCIIVSTGPAHVKYLGRIIRLEARFDNPTCWTYEPQFYTDDGHVLYADEKSIRRIPPAEELGLESREKEAA